MLVSAYAISTCTHTHTHTIFAHIQYPQTLTSVHPFCVPDLSSSRRETFHQVEQRSSDITSENLEMEALVRILREQQGAKGTGDEGRMYADGPEEEGEAAAEEGDNGEVRWSADTMGVFGIP